MKRWISMMHVLTGACCVAALVSLSLAGEPSSSAARLVPPAFVAAEAQPPHSPSTDETQFLLRVKVFTLDPQGLKLEGVVVDDLLGVKAVRGEPFIGAARKAESAESVVNPREADLIGKLLIATGVAKVVADPSIVTMDGAEARFHFGGEFPAVVMPQSADTFSIEFRQYGTAVAITPKLMADKEMIRLELSLEHSVIDEKHSIDINGIMVPGLNARRLETTLELKPGQTAILHGPDTPNLLVMLTPEMIPPPPRPVTPARVHRQTAIATPNSGLNQRPAQPATSKVVVAEQARKLVGRTQPLKGVLKEQVHDPVHAASPGPLARNRPPVAVSAGSKPIDEEIRELHKEVRVLRRDVKRLIELLENQPTAEKSYDQPLPRGKTSSNEPELGDGIPSNDAPEPVSDEFGSRRIRQAERSDSKPLPGMQEVPTGHDSEPVPGMQEVPTGHDSEPVYDGKSYAEWAELALTEQKVRRLADAVTALAATTRPEKQADTLRLILEIAHRSDAVLELDAIGRNNLRHALVHAIPSVLVSPEAIALFAPEFSRGEGILALRVVQRMRHNAPVGLIPQILPLCNHSNPETCKTAQNVICAMVPHCPKGLAVYQEDIEKIILKNMLRRVSARTLDLHALHTSLYCARELNIEPSKIAEVIRAMLKSSVEERRRFAIREAGWYGKVGALVVPDLVQLLKTRDRGAWCKEPVLSVGKARDNHPLLWQRAIHGHATDTSIHQLVMIALRTIGRDASEAIPTLNQIRLAATTTEQERAAAAQTILALGGSSASEAVED